MKNLFALTLALAMLVALSSSFSNFAVREEYGKTSVDESETTSTLQYEEDDGILTIDVISELSWEELVNKSQSITSEEDRYICKEDRCVIKLINALNRMPFIITNYSVLGISLRYNIDYDRIMKKFHCIIELYNHYHNLQVELKSSVETISNTRYLRYSVRQTNWEHIAVTEVGQHAYVRVGVRYWESSQNFGSGKFGIASLNNPHLSDDLEVIVTKVSYLDDDGNIISRSYSDPDYIAHSENHMLYIVAAADGTDLGWIYPTDLTRLK